LVGQAFVFAKVYLPKIQRRKASADTSRLSCSWGVAIQRNLLLRGCASNRSNLIFTNGIAASLKTFLAMTPLLLFPQVVSAQNAVPLQYQFQPNQTLRYRLDLRYEVKMPGGIGQDMPVVTKIIFQASARMVEVDSIGITTFDMRVERFSARTKIGSKETVSPVSSAGQIAKFRVGHYGFLPGQEALSRSSGLPWNLFLSQVFPDITRCRYLGPTVFNGKPCAKIKIGLNQGKGTGLFADGHLISGETQGSVDLGYSAKGTFSSRLFLLP